MAAQCSYCLKTFQSVGMGGAEHDWVRCSMATTKRFRQALKRIAEASPERSDGEGSASVLSSIASDALKVEE